MAVLPVPPQRQATDFWSRLAAHRRAPAKRPQDAIHPKRSAANREPSAPVLRSPAMPPAESIFVPPEFYAPKHSADPDRLRCFPSHPLPTLLSQTHAIPRRAKATNNAKRRDADPPRPSPDCFRRACRFSATAAPKGLPAAHSPQPAPLTTAQDRSELGVEAVTATSRRQYSPAMTRATFSRVRCPSPRGIEKHIPTAIVAKGPLQAPLAFEATPRPSSCDRAKAPVPPAA